MYEDQKYSRDQQNHSKKNAKEDQIRRQVTKKIGENAELIDGYQKALEKNRKRRPYKKRFEN